MAKLTHTRGHTHTHVRAKGHHVAVLPQKHPAITQSQFGLGSPLASGGELICSIPFPSADYLALCTSSTGLASV